MLLYVVAATAILCSLVCFTGCTDTSSTSPTIPTTADITPATTRSPSGEMSPGGVAPNGTPP